MNKALRNAAAGFAVIALLGTACGSGDDSSNGGDSTTTVGAQSGASQLRAGLTGLLREHVYLAGTATNAALTGGNFELAAAALDANSVELADTVNSVYDGSRDAFLELWRKHIGFFVTYTQASAAGDEVKKQEAATGLDGYRSDFGAFIAGANPNLTKDGVADALVPHIQTLFATINQQAAKDPSWYGGLKTAAAEGSNLGKVLGGAISQQYPDKFSGSVDSGGAELLSGLTSLLQEHIYLAGTATNAAVTGGNFDAAAATLDQNSVALADAIGSVYPEARDQFLELWRKHIGFFVEYTQGAAAGDEARKTAAVQALDGYRADFGAFISGANPNLTKDAIAEALVPHITSLAEVVDRQVAAVKGDASADWYSSLKIASAEGPSIASVLATAISEQKPDQFN